MRANNTVAQRVRRRALTPAEVAACLCAIGLLWLIIVPALAGVRRAGKSEQCLANLQQIGYANLIYNADDPADMALPVQRLMFRQDPNNPTWIGAYEWGGKSGVGRTDWITGRPGDPLNSKYGTRAGFGPGTRPLNEYIYGRPFPDYTDDPGENNENWRADTELDLEAFHCPSDSGYTGIHFPQFRDEGHGSYDHFGTSYTANVFWTATTGGSNPVYSNSPYLHRMSDLLAPMTTIQFMENCGRFAWGAAEDPCDFLEGVPGTARGWHDEDWTFNASFLDGHADTIYIRGYRSHELGPMEEGSDYSYFRCIIVRGEGWQLDTLPVPRVGLGVLGPGAIRSAFEDGIR